MIIMEIHARLVEPGEVANIQAKQRLLNSAIKEASDVIQRAKQRTDECRRHLSSKQQEKTDLEAATQRLQVQLQALETELQAPFTSGLTEADERREEELQARVEDMRKAILAQQRATDALWSRRSTEEAELGRVQSRITELRSELAMQWGGDDNTPSGAALHGADSGPDGGSSIETVEAELMLVTQELSAIERRTDANSDEILQASQQLEGTWSLCCRTNAAMCTYALTPRPIASDNNNPSDHRMAPRVCGDKAVPTLVTRHGHWEPIY